MYRSEVVLYDSMVPIRMIAIATGLFGQLCKFGHVDRAGTSRCVRYFVWLRAEIFHRPVEMLKTASSLKAGSWDPYGTSSKTVSMAHSQAMLDENIACKIYGLHLKLEPHKKKQENKNLETRLKPRTSVMYCKPLVKYTVRVRNH